MVSEILEWQCVIRTTQQWTQQRWKLVIKLTGKEDGEVQTTQYLHPSPQPVKDMSFKSKKAETQHHLLCIFNLLLQSWTENQHVE